MALDIFRIADNVEMTKEKLSEYIVKNRIKNNKVYKKLADAYDGDYEIFHEQAKASWKPDNRCAVNFAKFVVDEFEGFFIGNPVVIDSKDEATRNYLTFANTYDDIDDHNAELSKLVSIFGRAYELYYTDEDANICVSYLSPQESFMVFDDGINPKPMYFVRYYTDSNNVLRGSISDEYSVRYFAYSPSLKWTSEPEQHNFGCVPATEFVLNTSRKGLYESTLNLMNTFNHALSAKANDVDAYSNAYLKILGAKLDEDSVKFMRENRIINLEGQDAKDIVAEFMQRPDGDNVQENLLSRLEKLIFTITMIVNITDESFATTSGIALKYKMQPMTNLAKTKERKFKSGMIRRYKTMFSNPVSGMKDDAWVHITYRFSYNFPVDVLDEAQAASTLTGITSKRTQLQLITQVTDVDAELAEIDKELDSAAYSTDYPTNRTVNQVGD